MLHKIWLVALFCVAALLLALFLAPKLLPQTIEIEKSMSIGAPVERVFERLERPGQWLGWSGWVREGKETKLAGPETGPGAVMFWKQDGKTQTLRIAKTEPPSAVYYELLEDERVLFAGVMRLTGEGERTHLVWRHAGAFGDGYFQPIVLYFIRERLEASMHEALTRFAKLFEPRN